MSIKPLDMIRLPDRMYNARSCPRCGEKATVTKSDDYTSRLCLKRYRKCGACGMTYSTVELIVIPGRRGATRDAMAVLKYEEGENP